MVLGTSENKSPFLFLHPGAGVILTKYFQKHAPALSSEERAMLWVKMGLFLTCSLIFTEDILRTSVVFGDVYLF